MSGNTNTADILFFDELARLFVEDSISSLVGSDQNHLLTFFTLTIIGLSLVFAISIAKLQLLEDPHHREARRIFRNFQRTLSLVALMFAVAYLLMLLATVSESHIRELSQLLFNVAFLLHFAATSGVCVGAYAFRMRIRVLNIS